MTRVALYARCSSDQQSEASQRFSKDPSTGPGLSRRNPGQIDRHVSIYRFAATRSDNGGIA
jgi:hypothetical protein